jgi:hypothetical protein
MLFLAYGEPISLDRDLLMGDTSIPMIWLRRKPKAQKLAAQVIGFHNEDDWFDYKMEHDEKFLDRIEKAREKIRQGIFVKTGRIARLNKLF